MRRAFRRVPVPAQTQPASRTHTFQAPVRGEVANENLAAVKPGGAYVLENWFPTTTGIRVRAGSRKYATLTGGVESLFVYKSGGAETFFAADDTSIYDISAIADPDTVPTAAVTGQTSGRYSTVQFGTAGGEFLLVANGTDDMQVFDGSTWDATTITDLDTATVSHLWSYKSRIFLVKENTLDLYYLPVDSIGGAAVKLSLAGIFQRGGYILTGGTWSLDAGDGVDDKLVIISTEGEVAIYEGTDPSSAYLWSLVGRYDITPPLGKKALMQAGGDLLVATKDGIVSVAAAIQKDRAALSLAAVTRPIEPRWKEDVLFRGGSPWEMLKWPSYNMGIVSIPATAGQDPYCRVVNLHTGAWAKYTGWDTQCLGLYAEEAYFGTSTGAVMRCEDGGSDDGEPYVCTAVGLFEHLRAVAAAKNVQMARATFISSEPFTAKVSVSVDYQVDLPAAPDAVQVADPDTWDNGLWDVAKWSAGANPIVQTKWRSIGRTGFSVAPQVQITCGSGTTPDAELVSIDVTYQVGGIAV